MKRFLSVLIAAILCLLCTAGFGEEAAQPVSVADWLAAEGNLGDCNLTVTVQEVRNPVLAVAADESGSVNLFGIYFGEDFYGFGEGGFEQGDTVVLSNPEYNVFEGSVEMANAQLAGIVPDEALGERITVAEWLDAKGEIEGALTVRVGEVLNPALAVVEDETGPVNLFGITIDGENVDLETASLNTGDLLVLENPRYNEFEGTVEMAESVLARHISPMRDEGASERAEAEQYEFAASPDEETVISDLIFNGDVTVTGEGQAVRFINCEFNGNVVNCAPAATVVWIMDGCVFNGDAHCVLKSGVREATIEYPIPKFGLLFPVDVECEDLGGVIAAGDFDVVFNGTVYSINDIMYAEIEYGSIVPYEEGMGPMAVHVAMHWWENGEEVLFTMGGL